jgi:hypothetical protein
MPPTCEGGQEKLRNPTHTVSTNSNAFREPPKIQEGSFRKTMRSATMDSAVVTVEATADAAADCWAFLGPWRGPLRGYLHLKQQRCGDGVLIYAYELVGADVHKLVTVRDALILLAIVFRIDFCAFKHLLQTYCVLDKQRDVAC